MAATGQIFVENVWGFLQKFATSPFFWEGGDGNNLLCFKTYVHLCYLTIYTIKKCGIPREAGEIVNLKL
jgi:hypothetical protein